MADEKVTKTFVKVPVFRESIIHLIDFGRAGKRRVVLQAGVPIETLARQLKIDPGVILKDEDLKPYLIKIDVEEVPDKTEKPAEPEKPAKSGK